MQLESDEPSMKTKPEEKGSEITIGLATRAMPSEKAKKKRKQMSKTA